MIPEYLQTKIDQILKQLSPSVLKKARSALSSSYKIKNSSDPIFSDDGKKLAYLGVRFPATYAAVKEVLTQVPEYETLLDLGAGPATATLAASPSKAILIEKSPNAIALGKQLLEGDHTWLCQDIKKMERFPKTDLCIASYVLGEIKPLTPLLERLWDAETSVIAIIEPGTPAGYQTILNARAFFLQKGGHILAPCPHSKPCPLKEGNWCHFSTRLERTKLHRFLKEGERGFEDEKFSYLIVSRKAKEESHDRILRYPFKGSGFVKINLCTTDGTNIEKTISRKDKDLYRQAKGSKWGDSF